MIYIRQYGGQYEQRFCILASNLYRDYSQFTASDVVFSGCHAGGETGLTIKKLFSYSLIVTECQTSLHGLEN